MTNYDFWRAKNEGRPMKDYLNWLSTSWSAFKSETKEAFPKVHMWIITGPYRYVYFELWVAVKVRGLKWDIASYLAAQKDFRQMNEDPVPA